MSPKNVTEVLRRGLLRGGFGRVRGRRQDVRDQQGSRRDNAEALLGIADLDRRGEPVVAAIDIVAELDGAGSVDEGRPVEQIDRDTMRKLHAALFALGDGSINI